MASEKSAPPAAPAAADGKDGPPKKGGMKMIIAAVAVVVLEAATVGLTMFLSHGPKTVQAKPPEKVQEHPAEKDVEVKLIDAKLASTQGSKTILYDMAVVVKVSEKNKEKVTKLFEEREAEIRDQVRTIIASADPQSLGEPGLETIRRLINFQLEQRVGKELIKEVLIPKCTPYQM